MKIVLAKCILYSKCILYLELDQKSYKNLDIYNIGYVTSKKIGYGYDINSVNPFYLRIDNANGYIKEINEDKYLVLMLHMKMKNY